jgi:sugar phosphate isomerase/epimerase
MPFDSSPVRVPWRVGTTSFIHPGDWLLNASLLLPRFDDLELLFFEADGPGAFPDARQCRALAEQKRAHGASFSVHTPLTASLASEDAERRRAGIGEVERAIGAAHLLEPEAYVLHVYWGEAEHAAERPRDVVAWRERAIDSLRQILALGVEPRRLCVETLDYDFGLIEPVIEALDLSIALDIGHLVRDGRDALAALDRYLPRTRLLQWHGTDPFDRDHRSLRHFPPALARQLIARLLAARYSGVVTLEVFRPEDLDSSEQVLRELLTELAGAAEHGTAGRVETSA